MPIATPEGEEVKPFNPVLDSRQTVDEGYIEALMHCVVTDVHEPSDMRRRNEDLPSTILEGCIGRNEHRFYPPRRLWLGGTTVRPDQAILWNTTASLVLWEAQKRALSDDNVETLVGKSRAGIKDIRRTFGIDARERLYFDVDTEAKIDVRQHIREVKAIKHEVRALMENALREVLQDATLMEKLTKTAEIRRALVSEVVFKEIIEYFESVRSKIENPEDQSKLFTMLRNAVRLLGTREDGSFDKDFDVEVIPLSSEDAVRFGAKALYKPEAVTKGKAQLCIPTSDYGTDHMLSRDEILELVAHELAHHLSIKKPLAGKPAGGDQPHDLQHVFLEGELADRLREMRWNWEDSTVTFRTTNSPSGTPVDAAAVTSAARSAAATASAAAERAQSSAEAAAGSASEADGAAGRAQGSADRAETVASSIMSVPTPSAEPMEETTPIPVAPQVPAPKKSGGGLLDKFLKATGFRDEDSQ